VYFVTNCMAMAYLSAVKEQDGTRWRTVWRMEGDMSLFDTERTVGHITFFGFNGSKFSITSV